MQAVDGHDGAAVGQAIEKAKAAGRPAFIAARTHIGFGSPGKQGKSAAHGAPLGAAEVAATKTAWAGRSNPPSTCLDAAYSAFRPQREKNRAVRGVAEAGRGVARRGARDLRRTPEEACSRGSLPSSWLP